MTSLRKLFEILCFSAGIAAAAPSLTAVYNSASWSPAGLPNSSIAEGSIFVITGAGMGPTTLVEVSQYPLPTSQGLAGTTVQVTVGGFNAYCIMVYTLASQVAAILPSSTPVGSGTLTVTYQGSQSSVAIRVVRNSFGIYALNEAGSGPGVVTDLNYQFRVPTDAAHPGDILVIWGTGLGPISADETQPPPVMDLGTGVQVFVGGQPASVIYGGRGGSAGLDQINFKVPAGLSGCYVSVVVQVAGVVSNFTTIPITAAGQIFCSDAGGLTAANLSKVSSGGTLNVARLDLDTVDGDNASATFQQWSYTDLTNTHGLAGGPSPGSCTVYDIPSGNGIVVSDPFPIPGLDAGAQMTINGPNGSKVLPLLSSGVYGAQLSAKTAAAFLTPGTYTMNNGAGGRDIGGFSASVTLPQPLVWTNQASVRSLPTSQSLTLTWSGGGAGDLVSIIGITGLAGVPEDTEFFCTAQASAGQFTIPSQVLALVPSAGIVSTGAGIDLIIGLVTPAGIIAPNLDYGFIFSNTTVAALLPIN